MLTCGSDSWLDKRVNQAMAKVFGGGKKDNSAANFWLRFSFPVEKIPFH